MKILNNAHLINSNSALQKSVIFRLLSQFVILLVLFIITRKQNTVQSEINPQNDLDLNFVAISLFHNHLYTPTE